MNVRPFFDTNVLIYAFGEGDPRSEVSRKLLGEGGVIGVRWRVFHRTVQDIKARNADTDPDELQHIVDEAVREIRAERRARAKADRA
jgi:predicted nucleic acid-binding protein